MDDNPVHAAVPPAPDSLSVNDRQLRPVKQQMDLATEDFDAAGSVGCNSNWSGTNYAWSSAIDLCSNRSLQQSINVHDPHYCSGYSALQRDHEHHHHHHQRQQQQLMEPIDSENAIQQFIWDAGEQFHPSSDDDGLKGGRMVDVSSDDRGLMMEELLYPIRSVKELLMNGDHMMETWDNHCPNPDSYAADQGMMSSGEVGMGGGPEHQLPENGGATEQVRQQGIFSGEHVLGQNQLVSGGSVKGGTVTVSVSAVATDPQQQLPGANHPAANYDARFQMVNDQYMINNQIPGANPNGTTNSLQSIYSQQQQHRFINPNPVHANTHPTAGSHLDADSMQQLLHHSAVVDHVYASAAPPNRPFLQYSGDVVTPSNDLISANLHANLLTAGAFADANHCANNNHNNNGFHHHHQQQQQPAPSDPYTFLLQYGALFGRHPQPAVLIDHPNHIANPLHGARKSRAGGSAQSGGGGGGMEQQEVKAEEIHMRSSSSCASVAIRASSSAATEDQKPMIVAAINAAATDHHHQKQQQQLNCGAGINHHQSDYNYKRSRVDQLQQYRHSQQQQQQQMNSCSIITTASPNNSSSINNNNNNMSSLLSSGNNNSHNNYSPSTASSVANPSTNAKSQLPKKEKLGERITALQQLVAPFGKTDTASVLLEAIGHIKHLQEQVQALSSPYFKGNTLNLGSSDQKSSNNSSDQEVKKSDLRSRGLCLVPLSCTAQVANVDMNGADFWPYIGGTFRS